MNIQAVFPGMGLSLSAYLSQAGLELAIIAKVDHGNSRTPMDINTCDTHIL